MTNKERRIGADQKGNLFISTIEFFDVFEAKRVFNPRTEVKTDGAEEQMYETAVFDMAKGLFPEVISCKRYNTREEAAAGHAAVMAKLNGTQQ